MSLHDTLQQAGLDPCGVDLHRMDVVQRLRPLDGNRSKRPGWLKVMQADPLVAVFGDWRQGSKQTYREVSADRGTVARKSPQHAGLARPRTDRDKIPEREKAAQVARKIWADATPCEEHPYLTDKRVLSYGLRQDGEALLIPLCDWREKLWSLQRIFPDGSKRFLKGGCKKGCFYQIGEPGGVGRKQSHILICEGYATAATLYEALGWTTVAALDCYNLEPVAYALRRIYPAQHFLFAADNDRATPGNPGITQARKAAMAHKGVVVWPEFEPGEKGSDFNDLEGISGIDAVGEFYDGL